MTKRQTGDTPRGDVPYHNGLTNLRIQYKKSLPPKIEQAKKIWRKLRYYNWTHEDFQDLQKIAHNFNGNGQVFGFSQLSEVAKELEHYLTEVDQTGNVPDEKQQEHITHLIENLEQASKRPDTKKKKQPASPPKDTESTIVDAANNQRRLVFTVDDDVLFGQHLVLQLQKAGYDAQHFSSPAELFSELKNQTPAAVLMDIVFPENDLGGIDTVARVRSKTGTRTPIIFLSARSDVAARLRAVRVGGDAYFTKPANDEILLKSLDDLITETQNEVFKVLIIDDDKELAAYYKKILEKNGMIADMVSDPLSALEEVIEFNPDLIIMDYQMPNINGLELAKIITQDPKLVGVSIVFNSAVMDQLARFKARNIGNFEFVTKPVGDKALVQIVESSIRKSRKIKSLIKNINRDDPATGLMNRPAFMSELEKAISDEHDGESAFLYLTIDNFDVLRAHFGFAGLDTLLQELALRVGTGTADEDAACQLSEGVFGILSRNTNAKLAIGKAKQVQQKITSTPVQSGDSDFKVSCNIGIVIFDQSIKDPKDLFKKAEKAATRASLVGKNRIRPPTTKTSTQSQNDETKIVQAIRDKTFLLSFRPIITFENKDDLIYEAQIRLKNEGGRKISPAKFMPIAEKHNLSASIDHWMVEKAIEALSAETEIRTKAKLCFKLCRETIADKTFPAFLSNCLNDSSIRGEERILILMSEDDISFHNSIMYNFIKLLRGLHCIIGIDKNLNPSNNKTPVEEYRFDYVRINANPINKEHTQQVRDNLNKAIQDILNIGRSSIDAIREEDLEIADEDVDITQPIHRTYNGPKLIADAVDNPQTMALLWDWGVRNFQGYYVEEPQNTLDFDYKDFSPHGF